MFELVSILFMVQELRELRQRVFRHGLSFYATLAFVAGFFGARLFATLNPHFVVVDAHSGIHFHHFWYGLAMVTLAGWLAIALSDDKLNRNLALIFGFGAGLIGDEVGLLLTFGDYTFRLALTFFVGAVSFVVLATFLWRFREELEEDVFGVTNLERLTHVGVILVGFSAIFFAFSQVSLGFLLASVGIVLFLLGRELERRPTLLRTLTS